MPTIQFVKNYKPIAVETGSQLMKTLLAAGVPVASSCNGDGVCSKCRVIVIDGMRNLSAMGELETKLIKENNLTSDVRISCQTQVLGDIVIDTAYW